MAKGDPSPADVDAIRWPQLISLIKAGSVIPIVGPELLMLPARLDAVAAPAQDSTPDTAEATDTATPDASSDAGSSSKLITLERRVAERLATGLELGEVAADARVRDVANQYLEKNGHQNRWALQGAMAQALDLQDEEVPSALKMLAEISGFKLFVSVTADLLLERALNDAGRPRAQSVVNAPLLQKQDLPADLSQLDGPHVFYPFGRLDFEFAITEEDTLEFLFELLAQSNRFQNLFAAIRRSHLLFLGCNFPDWLTRFWIRALSGKSIKPSRDTLALIADRYAREDRNLVLFLKRGSIQIYDAGDANDFVKRLHTAWQLQPGVRSAPTSFAERRVAPQVFISYSWQGDAKAAELIHDALKSVGLIVWLDKEQMRSGQKITETMRSNIERSILFVPLLSHTSATRREGYYREEWSVAIEHSRRISPRVPFIHPVVVDDLSEHSPNADGIPPEFWRTYCQPAKGGVLPGEFLKRLRDLVRDSQ